MTQQSQRESALRKFLYLSRLPAAGWLQTPAQYQLSLHVGEDARNDPPSRPGVYATASVWPGGQFFMELLEWTAQLGDMNGEI